MRKTLFIGSGFKINMYKYLSEQNNSYFKKMYGEYTFITAIEFDEIIIKKRKINNRSIDIIIDEPINLEKFIK